MIAREVIEEILGRTDIVSLIGGYVALRRAGSNYTGLCPFHSERTPSFTVYPSSNSFYCFGCGAGGDAITFVRKSENLDYVEAVEFLAGRAGIRIPEEKGTSDSAALHYQKERIFEMNREAARFFYAQLHADTPNARAALAYFTQTRGLSAATITHFGLGYAPAESGTLLRHMKAKGYTENELIAGFLCGRSESGRLYDVFRNRVMFPIIDLNDRVVAFGGRVMDDSKPKYKNTTDTPVFKKSKHMFALNFARKTCAEQLILCEGYMDVIALHAAGFTNAVASLGTALTEEQARMLTRYTKKIIISYDMDEAGRRAADRAIRMFGDVGLEVKLLRLPDAKDPDEYIKKFGKERFARMLDESRTKFDYHMERILSQYHTEIPAEKVKALSALCDLISEFYSSAERDVYIDEVAKKTDVQKESVRRDVERLIRKKQSTYKKQETQKIHQTAAGFADHVNPDFVKVPAVARAEENVLGLMLVQEKNRSAAFLPPIMLNESDFLTAFGKKVFAYLQEAGKEDAAPGLNAFFTPDEVGRVTRMRIQRMQLTENGEQVFADSVRTLREAVAGQKEKDGAVTLEGLSALLDRRKKENS